MFRYATNWISAILVSYKLRYDGQQSLMMSSRQVSSWSELIWLDFVPVIWISIDISEKGFKLGYKNFSVLATFFFLKCQAVWRGGVNCRLCWPESALSVHWKWRSSISILFLYRTKSSISKSSSPRIITKTRKTKDVIHQMQNTYEYLKL